MHDHAVARAAGTHAAKSDPTQVLANALHFLRPGGWVGQQPLRPASAYVERTYVLSHGWACESRRCCVASTPLSLSAFPGRGGINPRCRQDQVDRGASEPLRALRVAVLFVSSTLYSYRLVVATVLVSTHVPTSTHAPCLPVSRAIKFFV